MSEEQENLGTIEQNKEAFDKWFYQLIIVAGTCLLRKVLYQSKDRMFEEWMKLRPWRF